jgi:hypothetical protein
MGANYESPLGGLGHELKDVALHSVASSTIEDFVEGVAAGLSKLAATHSGQGCRLLPRPSSGPASVCVHLDHRPSLLRRISAQPRADPLDGLGHEEFRDPHLRHARCLRLPRHRAPE